MSTLTGLAVIFGILASFSAFMGFSVQAVKGLRKRWLEDSRNTEAITANTKAIERVTTAIGGLSGQVTGLTRRMEKAEAKINQIREVR
jgi:hypothetical protein